MRRWLFAVALTAPIDTAAQDMTADFQGALDHIVLGSIDPGTSYTAEMWVKLAVEGSETPICATDPDHLNAFCLQYRTDTWIVEINDDDVFEADTCTDNQPHLCHLDDRAPGPAMVHVAVTVTPTEMALHLDGVRVADAATGEDTDWTNAEWALGIDAEPGEPGGWNNDGLEGLLDEVRIWVGARSEIEIACTIDWALTGAEIGLAGYWPLDVAPGGVTPDATGGGNDGTLMETVEMVSSPFALTPSLGGDIPCFDFDGDEVTPQDGDCDDTDASVHPDAAETWYDGVDADCDGANDYDADADGYVDAAWDGMQGGTASDGGDCADADASVHPGASEILDDGIDQDCSGHDRVTQLTGGTDCGCATERAGPGGWSLAWVLALALVRRRRATA
ncbi:MAG: hypothetical protein JRI25_15235 [Deltaproteobacteria bacterium]|nr:hypothetical protein [Deltaproteobacteria bacterium]